MVFSSPLQSITEKSPKYRPIFPIFSSLTAVGCIVELGAGRRWARVAGRTARSRSWASVRAGRARRARQAGVSGRGAQGVLGRAGRQAHVRWRARASAGEGQLGAGAGGRQGAGRAARRWARYRQALGARGARGLGAWAGLGQCTRPIFDPF